jgi:hypothetical protein
MPGRLRGALSLAVLVLVLMGPRASADEIAGTYQHAGTTSATLEVGREPNGYVVRLEGGAAPAAGAATPADCVIEARGTPEEKVLRARFGPVETETFAYDDAQAASEARFLEIVFGPGSAQVVQVDTLGYCGLEVEFAGSYRKVAQAAGVASMAGTSAAVFLQGMLKSAGRDVSRMRQIQAQIREQMTKQNIPGEISVADFVRRSDPEFEQQRKDVAAALGWRP